jgi:N-sulfoglucosamine sulfohydrolase
MRKRSFLAGTAAAMAALTLPGCVTAPPRKPLNVLLITVDDMDWSALGFMGVNAGLTPNIDSLAAASHRFVNNRAASPICQPSRQAMLTGLKPHRNGSFGFLPIRDGIPTLVTLLRDAGYFTAGIYKLHHMQPPASFPWEHPVQGIDRNPQVYESAVRESIRKADAAGRPFFINCNVIDPHRPFYGSAQADKRDKGQEGPYKVAQEVAPEQVSVPPFLDDIGDVRKELSQYWNSCRRADAAVGRVLKVLDDSGQRDQTIVIFTTDNGMALPFAKASCYDNGTRCPMTIVWPGMGRPAVFEDLSSHMDLFPTVLELIGRPVPKDLDGQSLMARMLGNAEPVRQFAVTEVNTIATGLAYPCRAVHDERYTLLFQPWADGKFELKVESMVGLTYPAMVQAAKTDPVIAGRVAGYVRGVPMGFYDLQADPGQRVNLMGSPEHRARIERMTTVLLDEMKRSDDPQLANVQAMVAGRQPVVVQDTARWRSPTLGQGGGD